MDNHDVDQRWCLVHATQMLPKETVLLARTQAVTSVLSVIRVEVESLGANYHFEVIEKKRLRPPADIRKALSIDSDISAPDIADLVKIKKKSAVLQAKRSTWVDGMSVTIAHLYYAPDFQLNFEF